ncbi:MAG: bifunctional 3-phenylpropionate/cinnamic acid dioxygenase ferredoxin subunit [Actinomycetes bacterium]
MIAVGRVEHIPDGQSVRVEADVPIAVFRVGEAFYAIDDTCTHQDASLAEGWVQGTTVECPLHSSCFDLRTGEVAGPPAKRPVGTHRVVVEDGVVFVEPGLSAC